MIEFVQNNLLMIAIAVISGGMLVFQLFRGNGPGDVTAVQATALINRENARIIDVRAATDYAAGHINGASNIPLENFAARIGELDRFKDRVVIVYCRSGNTARNACSILRKAGFSQVFNLAGGITAWGEAGLPLTTKGKK